MKLLRPSWLRRRRGRRGLSKALDLTAQALDIAAIKRSERMLADKKSTQQILIVHRDAVSRLPMHDRDLRGRVLFRSRTVDRISPYQNLLALLSQWSRRKLLGRRIDLTLALTGYHGLALPLTIVMGLGAGLVAVGLALWVFS